MLKEMIQNKDLDQLKEFLDNIHPHDLALEWEHLTEEEKDEVKKYLSPEVFAEFVAYMDPEDAADIITDLVPEEQKDVLEMMEPDDAADIIQALDEDVQQELVDYMGEDSPVVQLVRYTDDETGSIMTNQMIVLSPDMDVKDATKLTVEMAPEVETIGTLFVADETGKYLGTVPLKQLIKAKSPCLISTLIEENPFVYAKESIEKSVQKIRSFGISEVAVCDESEILLGMITHDDALDSYHEEATDDFVKLSALPEVTSKDTLKSALHRLPWLVVLLLLSVPIAIVTSLFEEILAAVVILIVFQPMILDSAGNVATQTLAVTLKVFSSGEEGIVKSSVTEILTGMINGFVIGLAAFAMTYVFAIINTSLSSQPLMVAFVVGLSLWLTVLFAPIVAIFVPLVLKAFKLDPSVASGPFITTIIDVIALVIYLGIATLMLGGL